MTFLSDASSLTRRFFAFYLSPIFRFQRTAFFADVLRFPAESVGFFTRRFPVRLLFLQGERKKLSRSIPIYDNC